MLDVERWAELRREHFVRGVAIKELVRRTGLSRNTIRVALRAATQAPYPYAYRRQQSRSSGALPSTRDPRDPLVALCGRGPSGGLATNAIARRRALAAHWWGQSSQDSCGESRGWRAQLAPLRKASPGDA